MDVRLTKHDWINAGLRILATDGASALKVGTFAAALGCKSGQGYYFAKPLEPEAALDYWKCRRS